MAWTQFLHTSLFGRRLGLENLSTSRSGTGLAGRTPDFLVGPEDIRKDVSTSDTTSTYLKAYGVSLLTTISSSCVFRLDPPIPGVEKTLVFGSTGAAAMYVTLSTGGAETVYSTLGSSFTVLKSTAGNGGTVRLLGVTTAIWAWIGQASTTIAAGTTTT